MLENTLDQATLVKINTYRKETRDKATELFDKPEELKTRLDKFFLQIDAFEKAGLKFDKEKMIKGLKEGLGIKDKVTFVEHFVKTLEPLIVLRVTQAKVFEKVAREETINNAGMNESGNVRLSEVLYADIENDEIVNIHLAPAAELIKDEGVAGFKKEVVNGLIKLAEMVQTDNRLQEVWATSWIVAKNPLLLKRLGFTVIGDISPQKREEHFSDEERPVAEAFMTREQLLAKYGK